jgi:fused signal recognition particle receptor
MGFFDNLKSKITGNKNSEKYLSGFSSTNDAMGEKLKKISVGFRAISEEFLEELMMVLLECDLGYKTSEKICERLEKKCNLYATLNAVFVMELLLEIMQEVYLEDGVEANIVINNEGPTVILMVGVNGAGKTTTCAKLARKYLDEGKTVAMVAADTFRAGAAEQLESWADRLEINCIRGKDKADPSSVLVDGCRYAKEHNIDILLCDTAGRLQNKKNLMLELGKMKKVIAREIAGAPHNSWLVLDSTTGQNGLSQAEIFNEVTDLNGIILTKMDGTSKGGIVLAIKDAVHVPVIFIGLGEKMTDLKEFDLDLYLYSISEGIRNVS